MALDSKVGNFALNTATGNQSVTGVGFQPKIVFFITTENTANGIIVDQAHCIGAAISSTERMALGGADENAVNTTDCNRHLHADECIKLMSPGSNTTKRIHADFVSMDSDGFTIDILNAAGGDPYRCGYLALGGTDLTDVAIGTLLSNEATGNQAITGVGFQPDAIMFFFSGDNIAGSPSSDMSTQIGFALSTTNRRWIASTSENGLATSQTNRGQWSDSCIGELNYASEILTAKADFVSFDADGFTVNWSDAMSSGDQLIYICLKGGQYGLGSIASQTSTGNFSETGVGFQPEVGMFFSVLTSTYGSAVAGQEISLGIAGSSTERLVVGGVSEDAQGSMDTDQFQSDALMYANYDHAQTLEGSADLVSWNSDGFTLNQVDADPSTNEILYFVIGPDAVVGGEPLAPVIGQLNKRKFHKMLTR